MVSLVVIHCLLILFLFHVDYSHAYYHKYYRPRYPRRRWTTTQKPDFFASVFSPIPRSTVEYEPIKFKFKSKDMSKYLRFQSTGTAYKDTVDYQPMPLYTDLSTESTESEESKKSVKSKSSVKSNNSVKSKKSVKSGNSVK